MTRAGARDVLVSVAYGLFYLGLFALFFAGYKLSGYASPERERWNAAQANQDAYYAACFDDEGSPLVVCRLPTPEGR